MNSSLNNSNLHFLFLSNLKTAITSSYYFLCPAGLVFNLLTMLVCLRKLADKHKAPKLWYYYLIISIVDNIVLILSIIQVVYLSLGIDIILINQLTCKLFQYCMRALFQLHSWLNVFLTIDIMLIVWNPSKYKKIFTHTKKLKQFLFIAFLVICSINSLSLKLYLEKSDDGVLRCTGSDLEILLIDVIAQVFRILLPFSIMLVVSIMLLWKFYQVKKATCIHSKLVFRKSNRDNWFIANIIALNILFFVSHFPATVIILMLDQKKYGNFNYLNLNSSKEILDLKYAYVFASYIIAYNYVCSFLINLKFNKMFYAEFVSIFFTEPNCSRETMRIESTKNRTNIITMSDRVSNK
jgi:hypothetical protein